MAFSTNLKNGINKFLAHFNMKVDSLTAERVEKGRLNKLEAAGRFREPVFPVLGQFERCDPTALFLEIARHHKRFASFMAEPREGGGFSLDNDYCSSPDVEVLYAIVFRYQPRMILEVGSGNSTLLFRQAISDAGLATRLISIDPSPRRDIGRYSDEVIRERVEDIKDESRFAELKENDILFIDSSHEIKAGNDVLFLFLHILPSLQHGVLIHIHDVFLPYEYPRHWIDAEKRNWTEGYLVQALLQNSDAYEVLWAGHYLEMTRPDFADQFKFWKGSSAKSLWLRKR